MTVQFNPNTKSRGIEWCTRTTNPIGGCKHACRWHMPDGTTAVCYAEQLAESGVAKANYPQGFTGEYWRPEALRDMMKGRNPDLVFCDSMSDMFGAWVPADQIAAMFEVMVKASHHTYQSLTKAPGRIRKFIPQLPENLWVGVSSAPDVMKGHTLNDKQKADYTTRALDVLDEVAQESGNITWMSLEPVSWDMADLFRGRKLSWVVIGAAMNDRRYYQPTAAHVAKLLEVFDASGTPVFFKGNIRATIKLLGINWREDFPWTYRNGRPIPAVVRRQEMARQHGWPLNTFAQEQKVTETGQYFFAL